MQAAEWLAKDQETKAMAIRREKGLLCVCHIDWLTACESIPICTDELKTLMFMLFLRLNKNEMFTE